MKINMPGLLKVLSLSVCVVLGAPRGIPTGGMVALCEDVPDVEGEMVIVELNNGGRVNGIIVESTDEGIVLDAGFGTVAIAAEDIGSLRMADEKEYPELAKNWKEHVRSTKVDDKTRKKELKELERRIQESGRIKKEMADAARKEKEHIVRLKGDNMLVEAELDGKVTTLLSVDTGATLTTISPVIARRLGYTWTRNTRKIDLLMADGRIREGIPITLRSIQVGDVKAERVDAVILGRGAGQPCLLGMSFLGRFHVRIDASAGRLVLKEK